MFYSLVLLTAIVAAVKAEEVPPATEKFKNFLGSGSFEKYQKLKAEIIEHTSMTSESFDQFRESLKTLNKIAQQKFLGHVEDEEIPYTISVTEGSELTEISSNLFEGDILLTPEQMAAVIRSAQEDLNQNISSDANIRVKRKMISDTRLRWRMPIRYTINSDVDSASVLGAIKTWQDNTCITFQNSASGNYMNFIRGSGCYSNIGMVGGRQAVSIGYGCESVGIAAHEIGHALGFWHEQTRYDRDSYVQIIAGSITSGASGNFEKRSRNEMVTYGIPYDFGSVMHYGSTAFGINNALTIRSIDPNYQYTMGQRLGLSFYDIKFINIAYCNSVCSNPLPCQNNGYTDPKNCNQCRCPDGFGGQYCNRAATGSSGCDPGDLTATTSWQTISQSGRGTCYWLITAPPGQQVILDVTAFSFRSATTCINEYLEIKFDTDLGNTGARMCTRRPTSAFTSDGNRAAVIFKGVSGSFSLRYRYDGPPVTVPPTTRPTTTRPTTTTPRPTTTSTTQTTTQSTSTGTTTQPSATGWASWGPWSSCSASCGGCGVRARRRDCYGLPCPGSIDSVELCNFNLCPGPELQSNGECSKEQQIPCESNTQNLCTKRIPVSCKDSQLDAKAAECCWPLSSDGTQCILGVAPATTTTTTTTTTTQDPLVSGTWGPWSEWTPCVGATCGGCGRRYRQRECLKDPCSGQSTMSEACNFNACICNQSVCANPCCAPYVFIPPDRCGQMANAVTGPPTDEHSSKV